VGWAKMVRIVAATISADAFGTRASTRKDRRPQGGGSGRGRAVLGATAAA
jgi:hypothetical protein